MSEIRLLEWDSDFFGLKVGQIVDQIHNQYSARRMEKIADEQNFELIYYSGKKKLNNDIAFNHFDAQLVDIKTTFKKKVSAPPTSYDPKVSFYQARKPSLRLKKLAMQSGEYSRFKTDKRIATNKFEELYFKWIEKIVSKELARDTLIYTDSNQLVGFLAIGVKHGSANILLASIDTNSRGKGLGELLFFNAEKWAYDNGFSEIQIVTQGNNIPACKLYSKLGYEVEKREFFYHMWKI